MSLFEVDRDSAQVRVPPPLLLLLSILAGWGLHRLYPARGVPQELRFVLGIPLLVLGVGLILYCAQLFRRANTDIKPWKTTSRLITTGVYRFTRNPIYLAFVLIGLGAALAVNTLWIALLQIPLVALLTKLVIAKEESYLEAKFGNEYRNYRQRVRRWI